MKFNKWLENKDPTFYNWENFPKDELTKVTKSEIIHRIEDISRSLPDVGELLNSVESFQKRLVDYSYPLPKEDRENYVETTIDFNILIGHLKKIQELSTFVNAMKVRAEQNIKE